MSLSYSPSWVSNIGLATKKNCRVMQRLSIYLKLAAAVILVIRVIFSWEQPKYSRSYFRDRQVASVALSAGSWGSPQQTAEQARQILLDQPAELFTLLSDDIKDTFEQIEFNRAVTQQDVNIVSVELMGEVIRLSEDWAEFTLEIGLEDGRGQLFLVVLHKEDEAWRIFGSKEKEE